MIACCGSSVGSEQVSAIIQLFEDYEKQGQKPKKVLELAGAKVETPNGSPCGSKDNSPYNSHNIAASPRNSAGSSGNFSLSPSPSSSQGSSGLQHVFLVTFGSETHEFRTESENDRLRWVKLLQLLVMFPYSSIPEEPTSNPIKESFRYKLDPQLYDAGKFKCEACNAWSLGIVLHTSMYMYFLFPNCRGRICGISTCFLRSTSLLGYPVLLQG